MGKTRRADERAAKNSHETPHETMRREEERDERTSVASKGKRHATPPIDDARKRANKNGARIQSANRYGEIEPRYEPQNGTDRTARDTDRQIAPPTRRGFPSHATHSHTTPQEAETIRATQTRKRKSRQEESRARDKKGKPNAPARPCVDKLPKTAQRTGIAEPADHRLVPRLVSRIATEPLYRYTIEIIKARKHAPLLTLTPFSSMPSSPQPPPLSPSLPSSPPPPANHASVPPPSVRTIRRRLIINR